MNSITTTKVTVKPMSVSGNDVECELTGKDVHDDAVFLKHSDDTEITFELVPGPAGTLNFHSNKPFCNQKKKCPPPLPGGNASAPFSVTPNSPTSITVRSCKVPNKGIAFFRLNFADGSSYDPIIIHG